MAAKKESNFQSKLVSEIRSRFPGSFVTKNDARVVQGVPDLLVLNGNKWAMLECKKSATASHQPNQDLFVKRFDEMSFARFISPENKEEVLDEMARLFET